MTDSLIQRAEILMQQQRYADAEKTLTEALAQEPDHFLAQALLVEAKLQLDKPGEAEQLLDSAIATHPDMAYLFYLKARIALRRDDFDKAEYYLNEAVLLEPDDADYHAIWSSVKLARKQYEAALEKADQALELDPENMMGLNVRSTALTKLGRKDESFRTIEGALREDPTNAYTHANYGWNLLEKGEHQKAKEHFREALMHNPNSEIAKEGLGEAIKATNPLYRLFLKYAFWMGNLTAKYQWGVILGFYIGVKVLRGIAKNNEALQPYLTPLIIVLALVAFSTWVITPISNLFLRFNAFGKHLLHRDEIRSANFTAISLGIAVLGGLLYAVLKEERYIALIIYGLLMMVPFSAMFRPGKTLLYFTIGLAILGGLATAYALSAGEAINFLTAMFVFGFIAFQWVANFTSIREGNR